MQPYGGHVSHFLIQIYLLLYCRFMDLKKWNFAKKNKPFTAIKTTTKHEKCHEFT